jgi:hypothetical protein
VKWRLVLELDGLLAAYESHPFVMIFSSLRSWEVLLILHSGELPCCSNLLNRHHARLRDAGRSQTIWPA